jgi:DNA-directed RNA polymerase specialized sigma24 family protein
MPCNCSTPISGASLVQSAGDASDPDRCGARPLATQAGSQCNHGAHRRDRVFDIADEPLLRLNEALEKLGQLDERLAQVIECRFFGGYGEEETAQMLNVTSRTVRRD